MTDEQTSKKLRLGRKHTDALVRQRRASMLRIIRRAGNEYFDRAEWAKMHGISQRQVDLDMKWLEKHWEIETIDAEKLKFKLHAGLTAAVDQARAKMFSAEKDSSQREWTLTFLRCTESLTRFLEDFGAKPKASERLTVASTAGSPAEALVRELLRDAREVDSEEKEK